MLSFVAVFLGWLVQGFLGIGSGIISTAILLFFYDAKSVVVSLSTIALIGTVYLSFINFRGKFFLKEVFVLSIFSFIGAGTGSYFLQIFDHKVIELIFGIVVIITGIYDLYSQKRKIYIHPKHKNVFAFIAGFIGGVISGLIGGAGPIYAFYLNQTLDKKEDFKFIISFFFAILNLERIFFYLISPELVKAFLPEIIIPGIFAVFLGAYIGDILSKKLSNRKFKEFVSIGIILFGIYFLYNSF